MARATELAPLRILGIDPGSQRTGFGLIEERGGKLRLLTAGAISAPAGSTLSERLLNIFAGLERVIAEGDPHEVAVEGLFHAKNSHSALLLGHARGVALLSAARGGLAVFEYAPRK